MDKQILELKYKQALMNLGNLMDQLFTVTAQLETLAKENAELKAAAEKTEDLD